MCNCGGERMRILLTGWAGFIGSHVLDRLLQKGHEVYAYDTMENPCLEYVAQRRRDPNFTVLPSLYSTGQTDYDVVLHIGALGSSPRSISHFTESWESNVKKSFKILSNGNYKHFIFTSSSSVYGDHNGQVVNTQLTDLRPKSPYATWKLHVEQMIKMFTSKYTIFRLFNVYGPRQAIDYEFGPVIPKLIDNKETIKIYNQGENMRCFTYISDVADLLVTAAEKRVTGIFNLCSVPIKVKKIVSILQDRGCAKNIQYVKENRSVDIEKSMGDTSATRHVFGWEPKVQIEEGLIKTIDYYK